MDIVRLNAMLTIGDLRPIHVFKAGGTPATTMALDPNNVIDGTSVRGHHRVLSTSESRRDFQATYENASLTILSKERRLGAWHPTLFAANNVACLCTAPLF